MPTRAIPWQGFHNARDLGGLPTVDGGMTRFGGVVRSADPRFVTAAGWAVARDAGLGTVIDLRNADEIRPEPHTVHTGGATPPTAIDPTVPEPTERVEVPLDDAEDTEFWAAIGELDGTPLYYRPFLEHKAARCAAVITTIARCGSNGVLVHCSAGRDRTGLVTLLLLALAGVVPDDIAEDYERSTVELRPLFERLGHPDQSPRIAAVMRRHGTSTRATILDTLEGFDAEAYLLAAGVTATELAAVRARLRG